MSKKIAIKDIIDTNKNPITAYEIDRYIGIDDLYGQCNYIKLALEQIADKGLRDSLAVLITRITVAHFYKKLQDGEGLDPISLKGNMLVDGRRRLWAQILHGNTEVEYINTE